MCENDICFQTAMPMAMAKTRNGSKHGSFLSSSTDEPVFSEPWEVEAFAMTVTLHEQPVHLRRAAFGSGQEAGRRKQRQRLLRTLACGIGAAVCRQGLCDACRSRRSSQHLTARCARHTARYANSVGERSLKDLTLLPSQGRQRYFSVSAD